MNGEATRRQFAHAVAVLSGHLVTAVHAEDPAEIGRVLAMAASLSAPDGMDVGAALVVVLASQVDPAVPLRERLGWVEDLGDHLTELDERRVAS